MNSCSVASSVVLLTEISDAVDTRSDTLIEHAVAVLLVETQNTITLTSLHCGGAGLNMRLELR